MNVRTKLILTFTFVVVFMGVTQMLVLEKFIHSSFEKYLDEQSVGMIERLKTSLELFYDQNQSWDGVHLYFQMEEEMPPKGRGMMGKNQKMKNIEIILLDEKEQIVFTTNEERGQRISGKEIELFSNDEKIGTLIFNRTHLEQLEQEFLSSANKSIIFGSILTSFIALIVGLFVSKKITDPLTELMNGIHQLSRGVKINDVNVHSKDEFEDLSNAFNEMAKKIARNEKIRKSLLADIAHELRTPLTILQGKLEMIQEGVTEVTEKNILELTDEVYRLQRLVQDLKYISLAEEGELPLKKENVDLISLLKRIYHNFLPLAEEKEIELQFSSDQRQMFLSIDKDRMTQVFVNILGNGIRHTPREGTIKINVDEKEDEYVITVFNSGPPIPKELLPFIFERFFKGDKSRTRTEGGTGLGLSIAKGFVEAHGGMIEVESNEEIGGTRFSVRLKKEDESIVC